MNPLPKVGCYSFGILGEKCCKEVVSEMNIFVGKWYKIATLKKFVFADLALLDMVETTLPDEIETSQFLFYDNYFFL